MQPAQSTPSVQALPFLNFYEAVVAPGLSGQRTTASLRIVRGYYPEI
jgi:hypothetical protein